MTQRNPMTEADAAMIQKHAMVERDGFKVPLIGVPPESVLQECDLCHDEFGIRDVELVNGQVLCSKCRKGEK